MQLQRIRQSAEKLEYLENFFILRMNQIYETNIIDLREAVDYYKNLICASKRLFTSVWKELDAAIGIKTHSTKTYSYKYINEVVADRFSDQWLNETKQQASQYLKVQIHIFRTQIILNAQTEKQAYELCKDLLDLTFQHFDDFKNETQIGTKKKMIDFLRFQIINEISKIRERSKTISSNQ
ncbi:Hypothetical_protein [Hexamita inflata]|uniref:Hypothetical_protein n=1 Tax=Hexamita inflata TaxID=28002 RepID=A0ABP1I7G5_9EUKA